MTSPDRAACLRKSRIATGICVICAVFGLETSLAHHMMPNPASPIVWSVLGVVGVAAAMAGVWFRRQADRR